MTNYSNTPPLPVENSSDKEIFNENFGKIAVLNGERQPLAPKLPLAYPFSITLTTANVCNLSCEYCAINEKDHKRNKSFLDMKEFQIFVDRLIEAHWHLKQIVLVGLGEPLLNKHIVDFVRILKDANVCDKVNIVSNGVALTPKMTDKLLDAGLDVLRISLNGLTQDDYKRYTSRAVNTEALRSNLEYFFRSKGSNVKLYIKIMDYQIPTVELKTRFNEMYAPICDVLNIEYLTEMSTTLDYDKVSDKTKQKGLKGFEIEDLDTNICPLPFYHIYMNAEGTMSACCIAGPWYTPPALQIGDLHFDSFNEIWNGEKFNSFLIKMLEEGKDAADDYCRRCKAFKSYIYPEDVIDEIQSKRIAGLLRDELNRIKSEN